MNSIEKIWSLIKRRVSDQNVAQDPKQIIGLTETAFASITAEDWHIQCEYVKNVEDQYFKNDGLIDVAMERFIKSTESNSDTDSDHNSEFMDTSDSDCDMSGIKSALMKCLEKEQPHHIYVIIIDGFFLLHTMKNIPKRFGNISKKLWLLNFKHRELM